MAKEILAGNGQISLVSCPDPAQRNSEGAWQHVMHPHVCMHGTTCASLVAVHMLRDHDRECVKSCISEIMESVDSFLLSFTYSIYADGNNKPRNKSLSYKHQLRYSIIF